MLGVEYRSSMPWTVGFKSSNVTTAEPFSWSLVMSKSLSRVVPFERTSDAAPYASGHHCFEQHSSEIQGDFVFFVGNDRNMVAEVAVSLPFEEPLVCDLRHTVDVKVRRPPLKKRSGNYTLPCPSWKVAGPASIRIGIPASDFEGVSSIALRNEPSESKVQMDCAVLRGLNSGVDFTDHNISPRLHRRYPRLALGVAVFGFEGLDLDRRAPFQIPSAPLHSILV